MGIYCLNLANLRKGVWGNGKFVPQLDSYISGERMQTCFGRWRMPI